MLSYFYVKLFSYSVAIATFIGLVRFKKTDKLYYPFLLFLTLGLINDLIVNRIMIHLYHSNALNGNIYVLMESLILLQLFQNWGSYGRKTCWQLCSLLLVCWTVENLLIGTPFKVNSFYRVIYSLLIVFFSIDRLNNLLLLERGNLFKNARFIICSTFILYYTFKATYEVFYCIPLKVSIDFYKSLFSILVIINLISNLLYAVATLWMPMKQKFTSPY